MDGSMVGLVYWEEGTDLHRAGNLERIVRYCEKDVVINGEYHPQAGRYAYPASG